MKRLVFCPYLKLFSDGPSSYEAPGVLSISKVIEDVDWIHLNSRQTPLADGRENYLLFCGVQ